ncbi:IDEAL domain-containing protein [Bacillus haikouensis]|uniref:IDEAL domain-containing protein n=1 Tax=Bacillus haikouensis TaxID=1510468 RepID=UPI0015556D0D|nr:IDEAL domain-containing protein [Bacillus haikouensis]NQD68106.1 IDEAL domain-containing protein [Bacillus haikouensis]
MKKHLLHSQQPEINSIDSLLAEMVLDEALLTFRKEQIAQQIDNSLCNRNKEEFLRLTEELTRILNTNSPL